AASGRALLNITGIVEIGPPEGTLVHGTLASAFLHALPHEVIGAKELMRRHPGFQLPQHYVAGVQPDRGYVAAERSIEALVALARDAGAQISTGISVRAIEPRAGGVRVTTDNGVVDARTAIVATGPWVKALLPQLAARLRVTRQVMGWFTPTAPALFASDR